MNWININVTDLDSEEFLGSSPVERATWLCLLRYCFGQENGGRIEGAREWKDRKWQQIVRVMQKEVLGKCDLWSWEGDDLVVWRYPQDKEEMVQSKRERARENGKMGGRPANGSGNGNGNGNGIAKVKVKTENGAGGKKEPILVSTRNQDGGQAGNQSPKAEEKREREVEVERKLIPPNPPVGGAGFVARFGDGDEDASEAELEAGGIESDGDGERGRELGESSRSSRSTSTSAGVGSSADFAQGESSGGLKVPTSEQARRLGAIMKRGPSVPWSEKEVRYFLKLGMIPLGDIALVESYYSEQWPPDRKRNMLRHDLALLLRNWPGEVTRAMHCRERGERPRYTQL